MIKIERDNSASYFKTVYIYDESVSSDPYSCIRVSKKLANSGKKVDLDPVWGAVDILFQQQHFAPGYVEFLIQALQVAKIEAEQLEREYPAGQKLYKD